ncbi:ankyrin repeat domain-containing protein [Aspergillus mulundensis]|uniref:Uncharacterized protein n=1 Tax=Aspergillus mulundensis TaxID=1810919 RepID=A0A3D8S5R2_9EURO|nr:hypothetical protein DSM5745_05097 [Aspergillus mulundensis]RDW81540.1 hypothetical protein DSM5745_05097 [Aspergillus mulundensis]
MSLLSLPSELLLIITNFLEAESDINAFCRANKHLYAVANDFLYKNNITNHNGSGIIHAVRLGSDAAVQRLLDFGADVDKTSEDNVTPLILASAKGPVSTVRILLESGADIQARRESNGFYSRVLGSAVQGVMLRLLHNSLLRPGQTRYVNALEAAVLAGHHMTARLLLDHGIEVDIPGNLASPLIAAAFTGKCKMARLLLRRGADPEVVDGRFGTALIAAVTEEHEGMIRMLLDRGANVNAVGPGNRTALTTARQLDLEKIEKWLLKYGAKDVRPDEEG